MATLHQLLAAVQGQVTLVTTGLNQFNSPIRVQVGIDWPPVRTITQAVKGSPPTALISVFDRKSAHDSTRWIPSTTVLTVTQTQLVSTPSTQIMDPHQTVTIQISGSIQTGDAISVVVENRGMQAFSQADGGVIDTPTRAVVLELVASDALPDAAHKLAAAVNADPLLSQWVTAVAGDPEIILTSLLPNSVKVSSFTGNGGTRLFEIARRKRELQVTIWTHSPEVRDIVANPVEDLIAEIETFRGGQNQYNAGLALGDGTFARVHSSNDFMLDDAVLSDVYRRDFIFSADYGITIKDQLYSVLAPVMSYSTSTLVTPLSLPGS